MRTDKVKWTELITGILLILLGIYSLIRPVGMLTGVTVIYGLFAVVTGIADIAFYVRMERRTGFGPAVSLVTGILSVLAGILILCNISAGRWAIAILFPVWFIAHCVSRLFHLSLIRLTVGDAYYYFTLVVNILGLVMGFLMLFNPLAAMLSVSWLIGIYLILLGMDSLMLAIVLFGLR